MKFRENGVLDSIQRLAAELVAIPSQGGIDQPIAVLHHMEAWLAQHELKPARLQNESGEFVALLCKLTGKRRGPAICLNACLDTAPFGDVAAWSRPPLSGVITDKKFFGRGAADSKIGASIIAHLAAALVVRGLDAGTVYLLFDGDEHTGRFGGVRRFANMADPKPDAVVLGYPGSEELIIGARGFFRATIEVYGMAAHSGAKTRRGINAICKMASLITALEASDLSQGGDAFGLDPVLTVSEVSGGSGYSQVPDLASCRVDIRITPTFGQSQAEEWLRARTSTLDAQIPSPRPTHIKAEESWPAYNLDPQSALVTCFQSAGEQAFGRAIPTAICGPSNIGNFLSTLQIPTICGLGAHYGNLHAADEFADLASVMSSYLSYQLGLDCYLNQRA